MEFSIPLYIETRREDDGPSRHHVRPLFFPGPSRTDEDLARAQQRLVSDLHQHLLDVGRSLRHEWLAAWGFCPAIEQHRIDLVFDWRQGASRGRFFFAVFEALGRKLAFCPSVPTVWFEILRHQTLENRARESLGDYFRNLEKTIDEKHGVRPDDFALTGTAWVTSIEIEAEIVQSFKDPAKEFMAMLGSTDVSNGALELRNCGRCLNWLYPSGLDRAYERDKEVVELQRRLMSGDRRPVLLLGRRQAGKSALVHEYVSQVTARRRSPYSSRNNVWLLSPQRLVSGMSYVGQWESRLLAILKEAEKRNHILYFDDLPGLLQAGKSRDANLSMGQVMRPYLERRQVRVLAEITPESWRVLRERDRALADLFDVLPIFETEPAQTAKIVLASRRLLEQEFHCQFHIDSLPAILEIERRYTPDAAFPGKAVRFLKDLALVRRGGEITRDHVLDEFHRRSGLSARFLDPRQRLQRQTIVDALAAEVVGQQSPVDAVADILTIAKARLNDTGRPLGSLLFVGPTGVGKTQLARAAARFLFGDAGRLLRFDLNEYISRGSATRLIGSFDEPDGLLTGSVRRQPFAVVLFDELEKAHPEVFDLLLQVLGEGRLSDGQGRTVSFANTLIIMTSNLGVRENSQRLGFGGDASTGDHVWRQAAQKFFRPEFFNRIDRVVPFQSLSREVIEQVAKVLLKEILLRDGLARRRCLLTIEPLALDRAVNAGFSPTLGARSLKRSLEHLLIQPAGRQLAAMTPDVVTQLHLYPSQEGISVQICQLRDAATPADCVAFAKPGSPSEVRQKVDRFTRRVEAMIASYRPSGPLTAGQVSDRHRAYYLIQERCLKLREIGRQIEEAAKLKESAGAQSAIPGGSFRHARKVISRRTDSPPSFFAAMVKEEGDIATFHDTLRELFDRAERLDTHEATIAIVQEAALAHHEFTALTTGRPTRIGLCFRPLDGHPTAARELADRLKKVIGEPAKPTEIDLALDCAAVSSGNNSEALLELNGLAAEAFAESESGVHLDYRTESEMRVIQCVAIPLAADQSLEEAWAAIQDRRNDWVQKLAQDQASIHDDPIRPGPVIRIYESWGLTLDLRTGDMTEGAPDAASLRRFLLGAFALPEEFQN